VPSGVCGARPAACCVEAEFGTFVVLESAYLPMSGSGVLGNNMKTALAKRTGLPDTSW
jgi:hypothetical protein